MKKKKSTLKTTKAELMDRAMKAENPDDTLVYLKASTELAEQEKLKSDSRREWVKIGVGATGVGLGFAWTVLSEKYGLQACTDAGKKWVQKVFGAKFL